MNVLKLNNLAIDMRVWQVAAFGVVAFVILRRMSGFRKKKYDAEGKTILITGANSGIGLAAATEFAKLNGRIILACRRIDKAKDAAFTIREQTNKGTLVIKHLDLASQASVVRFANDLLKTEEKLDVLVNNAGVFGLPFSLTEDGIETTFAVNHVSHFLLTNLLLDLLKKSEKGRVISISSLLYKFGKIDFDDINGEKGYTPQRAYNQSKLANIMFPEVLSKKLKGTGITVNSLSPGFVKTNLAHHAMGHSWWKNILFSTLGSVVLKTPKQGAETIIFCALDQSVENVSGRFFRDCQEKKLLPHAEDKTTALRLWKLCEDLTSAGMQSESISCSEMP